MAVAISTTCVSIAKCPVSKSRTDAFGNSFRKAFAPAGMKNGSFLSRAQKIASTGGWAFRQYFSINMRLQKAAAGVFWLIAEKCYFLR
jgi:hypothetical protein